MNSLFWSKLQCYCKVIQCIIFYFAAWSIPRPRNIGYLTHYYRTFIFCTTAVRAWFTLPEISWTRAQWKLPSARLPLVINTGHNLLEILGKAKGAGFRVQSSGFRVQMRFLRRVARLWMEHEELSKSGRTLLRAASPSREQEPARVV